jgi:hypothetical protein
MALRAAQNSDSALVAALPLFSLFLLLVCRLSAVAFAVALHKPA